MEDTAGSWEMNRVKFQPPCDCICRRALRGREDKMKEKGKSHAEEEHASFGNLCVLYFIHTIFA